MLYKLFKPSFVKMPINCDLVPFSCLSIENLENTCPKCYLTTQRCKIHCSFTQV